MYMNQPEILYRFINFVSLLKVLAKYLVSEKALAINVTLFMAFNSYANDLPVVLEEINLTIRKYNIYKTGESN